MGGEVSPAAEAALGRSHEARHVWGQLRILFDWHGEFVAQVGS